jgi:hypothetical protein
LAANPLVTLTKSIVPEACAMPDQVVEGSVVGNSLHQFLLTRITYVARLE